MLIGRLIPCFMLRVFVCLCLCSVATSSYEHADRAAHPVFASNCFLGGPMLSRTSSDDYKLNPPKGKEMED